MDPASFCVYNATRSALLSERVISVSEPQTPAQLLALVMNGPGRDPHFCIRLTNVSAGVSAAPEIPRLFAFDVAYLDSEQRIVATADVGPGTPFPPVSENVTTILFLSDQLLPNSKSEAGDIIRICTGAELAAILRATARFHAIESSAHPLESAVPQVAPDAFDGSLIYVPSSGVPQTREMFVPPAGRSSELIEPYKSADANLDEPAVRIAKKLAQPVQDFGGVSEEVEPVATLQPEPGMPEMPPPFRFFENSLKSAPEAPSGEEEQSAPSGPSQLPFNLRAVIQLVDEQLRREQQQEAESANFMRSFEKSIASADGRVAQSESEKLPAGANQLETVGIPPVFTEEVSGLPQIEAHANSKAEPKPSEALPESTLTTRVEKSASLSTSAKAPQLEASPVLQAAQTTEPVVQTPAPPPTSPERRQEKASVADEVPPTPAAPARAARVPAKQKVPFASRVQRWLAGESISLNGNRRRGDRIAVPGLVAFYFTGGAPKPHEIVNISSSGLYLRSKELWSPNTLVRMTLERDAPEGAEKRSISVLARVVRVDDGGIGHEFVTTEVLARLNGRDFLPSQGTNRKELDRFLAGSK